MPLFVLTCLDVDNGLDKRMATRAQHLAYLEQFSDAVKLAGPLLSASDGSPNGSLLVLEFPAIEQASDFAANDPYAKVGLFAHTTLYPFRATIGSV